MICATLYILNLCIMWMRIICIIYNSEAHVHLLGAPLTR